MPQFKRGINDDFVGALNDEYGRGGWWRNLVDDRETFVAIRENYVNVYYRGCSLLELRLGREKQLVGSANYKYLLDPRLDDENIEVVGGEPQFRKYGDRTFFVKDIASVDDLKRAARPYAEEEKKGVHAIILKNPGVVLDVEIAISDGRTARRIDLAAMHRVNGGIQVKFYEAKHFSNRELRAKGGDPQVIGQIRAYQQLLSKHRADIPKSYRNVCCNLYQLHGIAERHPERHGLLEEIVGGRAELDISTEPCLLVFGFDADQKDGKNWERHRDRLNKALPHRVTMCGEPRALTLPLTP